MLIGPGDVKVPGSTVVSGEVGDMATVELQGHHSELLDGVAIRRRSSIRDIVVYMLEMVGSCVGIVRIGPKLRRLEVKR